MVRAGGTQKPSPISSERNDMDSDDLKNRFTYHAPKGDQAKRYEEIRDYAHGCASLVNGQCPESREKSLALTHLEEAVFWANAAIARHE